MPGGGRLDEGGARSPTITVFVSDPSAEAERIAQALCGAGYSVVDVPLSMLVARVAVQLPSVVLVDADGDGALEAVARMRELPDADVIHVLFIARPGGAIASPEEAIAHEGSGLFVRPVDVPTLVRKVEAVAGKARVSSSPPSPVREASGVAPSLPPPSMRSLPVTTPTPVPPPLGPVRGPSGRSPSEPPPGGRRSGLSPPPVSSELQQLLADAEMRVHVGTESEPVLPSPEDEIEAVLPAELLAALDEPLEADDDDDELPGPARGGSISDHGRDRGSDAGVARAIPTATTGSSHTPSDGRRRSRESSDHAAQGYGRGSTHAEPTGGGISTTGGDHVDRFTAPGPSPAASSPHVPWHDEPPSSGGQAAEDSLPPAEALAVPSTLSRGAAMAAIARAIASRSGGALGFIDGSVERRLILREGDIVTAASSAEDESLLAFLGTRGDLPRETVRRLGAKFPRFGRHGGAALVARGYLGQEQMWPTLRAHAEWVLARVLQMQGGQLVYEAQPSGRLASEPSVFGGSPGAEVFVELVRRIISPVDAVERLGGPGARISEGRMSSLLVECALGQEEMSRLGAAYGARLSDALEDAGDSDRATVIFALAQLEVLEVLPSVGDRAADGPDNDSGATLDAEAIRERVRARSQLVDDGDYFAVLGVARDATGYEVRRAFLELRRAFDPSRLLTPEVLDLAADVRKITVVLEEAYEILKDTARRDRYRRAIEASPDGD